MPALCGLMIGGELNSLFSFDDNRPAYRRSKLSQRHHFIDNVSAERLPCHVSRRRSWHLPLDKHQPLQTHYPQALARRLRSQKNPGKTYSIEMNFLQKESWRLSWHIHPNFLCHFLCPCLVTLKSHLSNFFMFGPPKEDIFSDHLLWSIFQFNCYTCYKFPSGPLKAASMYCITPVFVTCGLSYAVFI